MYDPQSQAGAFEGKHDPNLDDASMHTITASSVQALPNVHDYQQQHSQPRPQTSYSDTGFARSYHSGQETPEQYQQYSQSPTPEEANGRARYNEQGQNISRPGSAMKGENGQYQQQEARGQQAQKNSSVVIKVGMVGDAQIGKTSLMVKYVEGSWDEDYIQTLGGYLHIRRWIVRGKGAKTDVHSGVNFMEKTISIRNTEITFSIWDLGGQREFVNMLPLVCNDAVAILFMFDLTRKSTLNSIKEWYRQGRGFNKTAIPFLVGTKYDHFVNFPKEEQEEISLQAKRFAKAMKASLIFSSTSHSINVQKV